MTATQAEAASVRRTEPLPERAGPRPRTSETTPHSQLDQQPAHPLSAALIAMAGALPGVVTGPSRRAPPGTVGFHLTREAARGPAEAFLIDREFAHVHPGPDHSLHLILPEPIRSHAIVAGWAEAHPLAGLPTVSPLTTMAYAPRDAAELAVVETLLRAAWAHAAGRGGAERGPTMIADHPTSPFPTEAKGHRASRGRPTSGHGARA